LAASTTGIHQGILQRIHLGVTGQGPILQAYPFCENSTPEEMKKKQRIPLCKIAQNH
jgi:hypothetical protein